MDVLLPILDLDPSHASRQSFDLVDGLMLGVAIIFFDMFFREKSL
jgi:hypothetical protein